MFAVPGWNISANNLKTQSEAIVSKAKPGKSEPSHKSREKKSKKRKRGHSDEGGAQVTAENLEELFRKHLDGRPPPEPVNALAESPKKLTKKAKKAEKQKAKAAEEAQGNEQKNPSSGHLEDAQLQGDDGSPRPLAASEPKDSTNNNLTAANPEPLNAPSKEDGLAKYNKRKAKAERRKQGKETQPTEDEPVKHKAISSPSEHPPREVSNSKPQSNGSKAHPSKEAQTKINATASNTSSSTSKNFTPLQQKMAQKLVSARFRHLNELLYTSPSATAASLFASDPAAYTAYHDGFAAQVAIWPSNPVLEFVEEMKVRGAFQHGRSNVRFAHGKKFNPKKNRQNDHPATGANSERGDLKSLPRDPRTHTCEVADLGAGTARFAAMLAPHSSRKKLNLHIRSFDLAHPSPEKGSPGLQKDPKLLTIADITDLRPAGVQDRSVDIAICCLSLMGTNWVSVVDECRRIVRPGFGEVWVAEVRSRFQKPKSKGGGGDDGGDDDRAQNKSSSKNNKTKGKRKDNDDEDENVDFEPEELEEKPKWKEEIDVEAFVAVWKRRGFRLDGEIDAQNKMFVKMKFLRERERVREGADANLEDGRWPPKTKFLDDAGADGEGDVVKEGKVLKPCVYKTR